MQALAFIKLRSISIVRVTLSGLAGNISGINFAGSLYYESRLRMV
jgi:hypothetical protein